MVGYSYNITCIMSLQICCTCILMLNIEYVVFYTFASQSSRCSNALYITFVALRICLFKVDVCALSMFDSPK